MQPTRSERGHRQQAVAINVGGVRISSPTRLVAPGTSKLDVVRYYDATADAMLPHLRDRPLTLLHCPRGLAGPCAFMEHTRLWAPASVRRERIIELQKLGEYLIVDTRQALLAVAQMDVLELHTWNARFADVERPDRVVFDLDPGPRVAFAEVVRAARVLRDVLAELGLVSFVKTTGRVGLHVVVPVTPTPWRDCLAFARELAEAMARFDPSRFTTRFTKAGRERQILVDYLRNNRANTSVAAFSLRARAGLAVSVPVDWDELSALEGSDAFDMPAVLRRVPRLHRDPWHDYFATHQELPRRGAGD